MRPEDISEIFGESHHCKIRKRWQVPTENGEPRTHLD